MPIIKSAAKRMRQTNKRKARNIGTKKDIKTATKAFVAKPTAQSISKAQSELDKAVKKGLIKKNTAARRKSALHALGKKTGVKLATSKKPASAKPAAVKKTAAKKPAVKKSVAKKAPVKKPVAKK
ncbi:30S ribosomal protein S20 [Candidatus Saccharibacteria bacterium]|nr:30S ribosomal protein S20 [Candidatus Saccharibacteria bacterium]